MFPSFKRAAAAALALVMTSILPGCALGQESAETTAEITTTAAPQAESAFTYRDSLPDSPGNWSPLDWNNDTDRYILHYTSSGLYAPIPAQNEAGFEFLPELAAAAPIDVTTQYAGNEIYSIPADAASGYAYRIDLNEKACWEDGTSINADTYLYSMEQLLSSDAKHLHASSFFSGQLRLANAYGYFMQDQVGNRTCKSLADSGYSSVAEAVNDGKTVLYLDMDQFWGLDCGWQSVDSEIQFRDEAVPEGQKESFVSPKYLYETYLADGKPYANYQTTFVGIPDKDIRETTFDQVGILKTGDYQITLILDQPISPELLQYRLTESWLIKPDLYEQTGFSYGTSTDAYAACGPYRLAEITPDFFRLERNENWYGYQRESQEYQTTAISCRILPEGSKAAFDEGLLDTVTLTQMQDGASKVPQTYVSKLTFNTSMVMLNQRQREGINKNILANSDFRKAISLCIDRDAFVSACVPNSDPVLGLLGNAYISDIATGQRYRSSAEGKDVISYLYGENPYDPEAAAALFQSAYDKSLAQGYIAETDVVELEFLVYSNEAVYTNITAFLQDAVNRATVGTSLENRITIRMIMDPDYYSAAKVGQFDMILSTWGGDPADPYGLMRCYCDDEKRFEFGFDPSQETCTITLGDTPITKTYRGWYESLVDGKYGENSNHVLAGLEYSLLAQYTCVPLYQRNLITLDSQRIVRNCSSSAPLVDSRDVRYVTYRCDDAAQEKHIAE